ncbi:MAG: hypothetical protein CMJ69_18675, partial [Planctomycetaceae bacterium]|nr:hypothetical protein [Planctomycetaceae bacterium]
MFFTPWLRTLGNRLRFRTVRKDRKKSLQKRSGQPTAAAVELLEDRTLLTMTVDAFTATTATITGDTSDDALVLSVSGGNLAHNFTGANSTGTYDSATDFDPSAGIQTIAVPASFDPTTVITVQLGDGADTLTIDDSSGALQGRLNINFDGEGGAGDTLIGPDTGGLNFSLTASNSGNVGGVGVTDFSNVENLTGGSQADTFSISSLVGLAGTIDGGGGSDTIVQADDTNTWTISSANAGDVTDIGDFTSVENLTGGTGADTFNIGSGGSLSGDIDGGGGSDTITQADGTNTWDITGAGSGTGPDVNAFSAVENLTGGSEADTFNIASGGSLTGDIDGGGGTDTLTQADGTNTWTISSTNGGSVDDLNAFSDIENLTGGSGPDTFNIASLVGLAGTIDGGGDSDTITQADDSNTWTISSANAGDVTDIGDFTSVENLTGGTGADTFNIGSTGSLSGDIDGGGGSDTVSQADGTNTWNITGSGSGTGSDFNAFSAVENLTGGSGPDTFNIASLAGLAGTIDGGGDSDTITQADDSNTWTISSANAGDVTDIGDFTSIENLTGGTGSDTFDIGSTGSLSGAVDGGGGSDTVSQADGTNTWDITGTGSGTVPDINSFSSVENLSGGTGDDTFNVSAGAGVDSIDGNGGSDSVSVNAGGNTVDHAVTGPDDGTITVSGSPALDYSSVETRTITNAQAAGVTVSVAGGDGTADGSDSYEVRRSGSDLQVLIDGTVATSVPFADVAGITVAGTADDDTLTVDFGGQAITSVIPSGELDFNGGAGNDALVLSGTPTANPAAITHTFDNASDGNIDIDGSVINYTGLAPITDTLVTGTRTMVFNASSETITISDDGEAGDDESRIDSSAGEQLDFQHPTNALVIRGDGGDDTIDFDGVDSQFPGTIALTVDGEGGTDSVNFNTALSLAGLTVTGESIAVDAAITTNGATLTAVSAISVLSSGSLDAGVGNTATLTATSGSITGTGDGSPDITAGTVNLTVGGAGGEVGSGSADPLEIDATTVNATSGGAVGDDISIEDTASGVLVGLIDAGSADVVLSSVLNIGDDDDAAADVVAGGFTATAVSGIDLETTVGSADLTSTSSGDISIGETDGLDLAGISTGGDFNLTASGAVTGSGVVTVGQDTSLTAGSANNITLNNASNDFGGPVTVVSGNDVTLQDVNALDLGNATVSGDLDITVPGGALTDSGTILVTGLTDLNATGQDVTLDSSANDFNTIEVNAAAVQIVDVDDIDLGNSVITSTLTLDAGGTVTDAAGSSFAVAGNSTITVTGGGDITLDDAPDFDSADTIGNESSFTGANLTVTSEINGLRLQTVSATGSVVIASDGTIELNALGSLNTGTSLSMTASGASGQIQWDGPGTVGNGAVLVAGDDIDFSGTLTVTSGDATVLSGNDIDFDEAGNPAGSLGGLLSVVSGNATLTASDEIFGEDQKATVDIEAEVVTLTAANGIGLTTPSFDSRLQLDARTRLDATTTDSDAQIEHVGGNLVVGLIDLGAG